MAVAKAKSKELKYDESAVRVLKGLDAVRGKPSMYIGPLDDLGIFTIGREPSDNFADEWAAGRCSAGYIWINTKTGRITIYDNGQGMPVGKHKTEGCSTLEVLVSRLHAGAKLSAADSAYKNSRGTHGIGIKATNALSATFQVFTMRDKKWYEIGYEHGKLVQDVAVTTAAAIQKVVPMVYKHGTIVTFIPDWKLFDKGAKINPELYEQWCQMTAYLSPGLSVTLRVDNAEPVEYLAEDGIGQWIDEAADELGVGFVSDEVIQVVNEHVDIGFSLTDAEGCQLNGYTNGLLQAEGGNHLTVTIKAFYDSLTPYANSKEKFTKDDLAEGLLGLINFKVDSPKFSSQDKRKLTDTRFEEDCLEDIESAFADFWKSNKKLAREMCVRASSLQDAKAAFRVQKGVLREIKKASASLGKLPIKLAQANNCKAEEREIFIVEGDSAGGTAKAARMSNPRYQETLGAKGKITNSYRAKQDAVFSNPDVIAVLAAIGFNPDASDPLANLRVGKIILLSDADPDGYHINSLWIALFALFMPGLFERGLLYTVVSPKYMLNNNGTQYFGMTLPDLEKNLPKGVNISNASYLKGWGEATATAMRAVAFNPETRKLIQLQMPSKKDLAEMQLLMGENADYRKAMLGIEDVV